MNNKIGLCNEMFQGRSWEETLACAASLGYDGIEIAPFTFGPSITGIAAAERSRIRRAAEQAGLEIIGLHWLLACPPGLSACSPDESVRARTTACLEELVDFCAELGGRMMVFGSPAQRSAPPGLAPGQGLSRLGEILERVLARCAGKGVIIALEPLARTETNLLNTAAETLEFIDRLGHPNLGLHLDVKAMSDEGIPLPEIIAHAGCRLVHFHANDERGAGPGVGPPAYGPIRDALVAIGYRGYLSVEVFDFSPGPETIARRSIGYLRGVFGAGHNG